MESRSHQTRAGAWLEAAELLLAARDPVYNLVVEITEPGLATPQSRLIEERVDAFLQEWDCQPSHTVADTIFPATEYISGGLKKLYEYPTSIFPHIKSIPANRKGTYALRLVQRSCSDNKLMNPLDLAIKKLRAELKGKGPMRAVYELDLTLEPLELKFYEAELDHDNHRSGQCLSHISLKLGPNRELYLTAMYRYQYFVQKALGNFKGLARLQDCIAREVGISTGPLVCHATLAALETGKGKSGETGWGRARLEKLVKECRSIQDAVELKEAA